MADGSFVPTGHNGAVCVHPFSKRRSKLAQEIASCLVSFCQWIFCWSLQPGCSIHPFEKQKPTPDYSHCSHHAIPTVPVDLEVVKERPAAFFSKSTMPVSKLWQVRQGWVHSASKSRPKKSVYRWVHSKLFHQTAIFSTIWGLPVLSYLSEWLRVTSLSFWYMAIYEIFACQLSCKKWEAMMVIWWNVFIDVNCRWWCCEPHIWQLTPHPSSKSESVAARWNF